MPALILFFAKTKNIFTLFRAVVFKIRGIITIIIHVSCFMLLITKMFSTLHKTKLPFSPFSSFRGQSFIIFKRLIYKPFVRMSTTTVRESFLVL